jgi:hypothetical protein
LRKSAADARASQLFQSDNLYADWTNRVGALIRTVDEFNAGSGFSSSLLYDNLTGMTREMGATLRDFHQNPGKYLKVKIF